MRGRPWVSWPILLGIWGVVGLSLRERGGYAEWFAWTILTGIMLLAMFSPLLAVRRLAAERRLQAEVLYAGEKLEIELRIEGAPIMPLVWIAIQDELSSMTDAQAPPIRFSRIVLPWFRTPFRLRYSISPLCRGEWRFDCLRIEAGDLLGLCTRRLKLRATCDARVLVLPKPAAEGQQLQLWNWGAARPGGTGRGVPGAATAARHGYQAGAGEERRPYMPGDDIRHLDWRQAAKGRELQVRKQGQEGASRCLIVLDGSAAAFGQDMERFDACVAKALYAYGEAVRQGMETQLLCSSAQPLRCGHGGQAARSGAAAAAVLLARVRPDGPRSLPAALAADKLPLPQGGVLLCISGEAGGWAELLRLAAARRCRAELWLVCRSSAPAHAVREQLRAFEQQGGAVKLWTMEPRGRRQPAAWGEEERHEGHGSHESHESHESREERESGLVS